MTCFCAPVSVLPDRNSLRGKKHIYSGSEFQGFSVDPGKGDMAERLSSRWQMRVTEAFHSTVEQVSERPETSMTFKDPPLSLLPPAMPSVLIIL